MEKYFTLTEAINYLMEEHNAGECLIGLMRKELYNNPDCLVSKEDIDNWLKDTIKVGE